MAIKYLIYFSAFIISIHFQSILLKSTLECGLHFNMAPYDQRLLTKVPLNFEIFAIKVVGQTIKACSTTKRSKL